MAQYERGTAFPNEGFVQLAIEQHFSDRGFSKSQKGRVDLCCSHPGTNERWVIEAKGETADRGLDFRTGLGQLIQAMDDRSYRFGIAVPDTKGFRYQLAKVPQWVRQALGINWLLVDESGSVRTLGPDEKLDECDLDREPEGN